MAVDDIDGDHHRGPFREFDAGKRDRSELRGARFALPEGEEPTAFARITLRPKEGLTLRVTIL